MRWLIGCLGRHLQSSHGGPRKEEEWMRLSV
nr:MAG TPA: hypothetical protein [Caudoviricetes sp.]